MRIESYPRQEPLSEAGQRYGDGCLQKGEGIEPTLELAYGDDPYQTLSIFRSSRPDGRVLAFVHGGGWTSGYKEWMHFMAPAFTAAGVTFASIGYRLAPGHIFPSGYEDVADGLVRLKPELPGLGGDWDKLFAGGHSAGGHYTALLATRNDWWRQRGLDRHPLRGCLPVSGVYRFGEGSGLSARPRFLGPEDDGVTRAASPIADIEATPHFLIAYGENDFPHLRNQAIEMTDVLAAHGAPVRTIRVDDADHFAASFAAGDAVGPWVPEALRFMDDALNEKMSKRHKAANKGEWQC